MKASELIAALQKIINERGDLEFAFMDGEWATYSCPTELLLVHKAPEDDGDLPNQFIGATYLCADGDPKWPKRTPSIVLVRFDQ